MAQESMDSFNPNPQEQLKMHNKALVDATLAAGLFVVGALTNHPELVAASALPWATAVFHGIQSQTKR